MSSIVFSVVVLCSCLVWIGVMLRAMRGQPLVPAAGVRERVPALASYIGIGWILYSLVAEFTGGPVDGAVTISGLRNGVAFSGGFALLLAIIYSLENSTEQDNQLSALRAVWLGLFACVASAWPVLMVQSGLQRLLGPDQEGHRLLEFIRSDKSVEATLWVGAAAVVAAPLLEELLYRVILQGTLRARVSSRAAIGVTAVVFCLAHGWPAMLGLLPLAIILGYLYEQTNSYLAVVTTHAAFNMGMLLLTTVTPNT